MKQSASLLAPTGHAPSASMGYLQSACRLSLSPAGCSPGWLAVVAATRTRSLHAALYSVQPAPSHTTVTSGPSAAKIGSHDASS